MNTLSLRQLSNIACCFLFALLLSACEKEEITPTTITIPEVQLNEVIDNIEYTYYLDGEAVSTAVSEANQDENYHVLIEGASSNAYEAKVITHVFTTDEAYYAFGRQRNLPCEASHRMELHIAEYVAANNVIEYYERTGEVKPGFEEFSEAARQRFMPNPIDLAGPRITASLYRGCANNGEHRFALSMMPTLLWNNQVSLIRRNAVFGWTHVYDRSFYRRKLFSYFGWGIFNGNEINMCNSNQANIRNANNRMSSGMFL